MKTTTVILFCCLLQLFGTIALAQPTWFNQTSGISSYIFDIEFVDANTGYAVGAEGKILKTINGGATWNLQTSGTTMDIWDCQFNTELLGWACGEGGVILKTNNGGSTWSIQSLGTPFEFHQINFVGTIAGVVAGKNTSTSNAVLYYCTDGGTTWTPLTGLSSMQDVKDIEFVNATTGFAVDFFEIHKTTDAGFNWTSISVPTTAQTNRIEMYDATHGWLCGGNGTVLYTSDGGLNWTQQATPVTSALWGISIVDLNTVFISGHDGTLISTSDGGSTWVVNSSATTVILPSISAVDANNVWACGENGTIIRKGGETDLKLSAYEGTSSVCQLESFEIIVSVKNEAITPVTDVTFYVFDGITPVLAYPWTGYIPGGGSEQINLGSIEIDESTLLTISFTGDDITGNNSIIQPISIPSDQATGVTAPVTKCPGESFTIEAFGGLAYYWHNATSDSTSQTQLVSSYNSTEYHVEIIQSICVFYDTVYVTIDPINCSTNAFSPNNDGINDIFTIDNLPAGDNSVTIFNRWGDEIVTFLNYNNTSVFWEAKDAFGNNVPEGVYFFVVESPITGPALDGWVNVIR